MGLFDRFKKKTKDAVDRNEITVEEGTNEAAATVPGAGSAALEERAAPQGERLGVARAVRAAPRAHALRDRGGAPLGDRTSRPKLVSWR